MRVGTSVLALLFLGGILLGAVTAPLQGIKAQEWKENVSERNTLLFVCSEADCGKEMAEFIDSAKESVHVMIYSFTLEEIGEALVEAKKRGLDVRVVMDEKMASGEYSLDEWLVEQGLQVRLFDGDGAMHHKIAIVDGEKFSTGSFNYSKNAVAKNRENLLFIYNSELAFELEEEFEFLWFSTAEPE